MSTIKSHFVSKVILKNFSKDKKIGVFDKSSGLFLEEAQDISDIGYVNLPSQLFSESEEIWSKSIENKIGNLFQKYNGDIKKIYFNKESHPAFRRLLSLHFVRSLLFLDRLENVAKEKTNELLKGVPESFHRKVASEFLGKVVQTTPNLIDDFYKKIKNELDNYELELVQACKSENFIIGDIPIINDKKAVKDSEFFMLPISPKFIIGVSQKKGIWNLSTKDTRMIKKKVKRDSRDYWFCYPSNL